MLSVLGFLAVLAPLVIVHELGHLLFAKLFNVKAEAFSVGFGPVVFHRKWGETDYRFSAIPLGGYVKLLGEDPSKELSPEDKKRALGAQAPYKRFFIFFGGPLFNFIWAALVFMVMMALGEPQLSSVVGRVFAGSEAEKAGLLSGDKITEVNNVAVKKFEDLMEQTAAYPNQVVQLKVERPGFDNPIVVPVKTIEEDGYSQYGEEKKVGILDGIYPFPRNTKVGNSDAKSAAAMAGFQTNDEIVSAFGRDVKSWEEIARWSAEKSSRGVPMVFKVKRGTATEPVQITLNDAGKNWQSLSDLGLHSIEMFIDKPVEGSPAEKAGIKPGDRMVGVSGQKIASFWQLRLAIQDSGEKTGKIKLAVERAGETKEFEITPNATSERDPLLKKKFQYTIGVVPMMSVREADTFMEKEWNPFVLVYKGTARMLDLSGRNLVAIWKMIKGEVSIKTLGGPVLIGKLAGDSLSRGLLEFLRMMGILSIGLGVLNILPIPVLDGGHIAMLLIEVVRGRALSIRQIEIAQQVGMVIVGLIMIVVMRNDLSRLPIFN